jgi:lysine decarboxylase
VCFAGLEEIAGRKVDWRSAGYMKDPLKIVLMLKSPTACDTFKKALLKAHIQWEKSSSTTILFLVTVGTIEEHFEYLFRVCRQHKSLIGAAPKPTSKACAAHIEEAVGEQPAVLPHDAALCDGELVEIDKSEGRIASQFIVPYPPGIPVLIPGLRITKAMIRLIHDVIDSQGVDAVHGLFCRGGHAPYFVEVLNRDEEARIGVS